MEFSVNYSPALAELVREGQLRVDRFKCPAWPDLLEEVGAEWPLYVHFPFTVGAGQGGPVNDEKKQLADLDFFAEILETTGTPQVNTHLIFNSRDYPDIPLDSREPRHAQRLVSAALRDLEPLIRRFGAERVTVENIINEWGWLTLSVLPEVITRVLDETGCGFLFDLSHARLAARNLGIPEREYAAALPVDRIREVHVTGLQRMAGEMYERLMAAGNPGGFATMFAGKEMDHLPMLDADWVELEWMMAQIHSKAWRTPWVTAVEVGGVGGFWEMISTREVYLEQVPRLEQIIRG